MNSAIWSEKYRPQTLDAIVGNANAVAALKCQTSGLHHLLLCGPAGVGKTSALHCLARVVLGPTYSNACLELNAADERGIEVVREKIKTFAKVFVSPERKVAPEGSVRKIVILDEVEAMTDAAQQALRRIMEVYDDTRFYLACNHSEKVIEPVQSRCFRVNMMPVDDASLASALRHICKCEGVTFEENAMQELVLAAAGDMRKAVGSLQAAATAYGNISIPTVYHACDMPPTDRVLAALDACRAGDWRRAHTAVMALVEQGYANYDILRALRTLVNKSDMADAVKTAVLQELAFAVLSTDRTIDKVRLDATLCNICIACLSVR